MIWKPDYCSGGQCTIDLDVGAGNFWTPARLRFTTVCGEHGALATDVDRMAALKEEARLKEGARQMVAEAISRPADDIAWAFDAQRRVVLTAPVTLTPAQRSKLRTDLRALSTTRIILA